MSLGYFLIIIVEINNVFRIVSISLPISNSFSLFSKLWGLFLGHWLLFVFFHFHSVVLWNCKIHEKTTSIFLFISIRSNFLVGIRWSFCIWIFTGISVVLFFYTDSGLCTYHLIVSSNIHVFLNILWILKIIINFLIFSFIFCFLQSFTESLPYT